VLLFSLPLPKAAFTWQTKVGKLVLANSSWCVWTAQKQSANMFYLSPTVCHRVCAVHTHQLEFANFSLPCEGRLIQCWNSGEIVGTSVQYCGSGGQVAGQSSSCICVILFVWYVWKSTTLQICQRTTLQICPMTVGMFYWQLKLTEVVYMSWNTCLHFELFSPGILWQQKKLFEPHCGDTFFISGERNKENNQLN